MYVYEFKYLLGRFITLRVIGKTCDADPFDDCQSVDHLVETTIDESVTSKVVRRYF